MPRSIDKEIFDRAMALKNEGKSYPLILRLLEAEFKDRAPTNTKTIERWVARRQSIVAKLNQKMRNATVHSESDDLTLSEIISQDSDFEKSVPVSGEIPVPPALDELVSRGIQEEEAVTILSFWDIAYRTNDLYIARHMQKYSEFLADDPDIPARNAWMLAEMAVAAEEVNHPGLFEMLDMAKRYKPWRSKAHAQGFDSVLRHIDVPRMSYSEEIYSEVLINREKSGKWKAVVIGVPDCIAIGASEQEAFELAIELVKADPKAVQVQAKKGYKKS